MKKCSCSATKNQTKLHISDNSGAKIGGCIRVLKGSSALSTGKVGDYVVVSIKKLKMKRKVKKKDIFFGLIIRTAKESINEDGSYSKFKKNGITLLNKKKRLFTTKIIGPVSKKLRANEYKKIYFQLKSFLI